MNDFSIPFIPGSTLGPQLPLSRYLPPLPAGVIQPWLQKNVPPGSIMLDPLCATPALALEAARAGYRVLVTSNNPILSFMLEMLASAPQKEDFQSALSELASSRRGDERLEVHLQSLYLTECANCGRRIQAQAYFWRKGEAQPYARLYHCPYCGDEGEHPLAGFDLERLAIPGNAALHRARAIERVSQAGDNLREGVEEALQAYLPRPLYFLFTLINKIEGLPMPAEKRRLLVALALTVCDEATNLWPHPSGRLRPRQLTTLSQFCENNLWLALENAVQTWSSQPGAVPFSHWSGGEIPPGGIALYQGRLKSMPPLAPGERPAAAVVVLPRPNQAYWTLCALWSGWLWGQEAVKPLHSALERRRYDWHWHTGALYHALTPLNSLVRPPLPVFGVITELVPGFFAAALIAAEAAGLHLQQLAAQPEAEIAQLVWSAEGGSEKPAGGLASWEPLIEKGTTAYLAERSEPAPFLSIYMAALSRLAVEKALPFNQAQFTDETIVRLQNSIQKAFSSPTTYVRFESRPQNIESGLWWLASPPPKCDLPLADRVEMEIVKYLQKNPGRTQADIEEFLYRLFPGLLTPSRELIRICLQSYGDASSSLPEYWQLRSQESPALRRADLEAARAALNSLAERIGLQSQGEGPVVWSDAHGAQVCYFTLLASGIISRYVLNSAPVPPARCILVLPGSRANLVAYKMRHDPRLEEGMSRGWRFLKFRLLRQLLERANLNLELFDELLLTDPPHWEGESTQLSIFPAL
jgi:hypothetical protein